MTIVSPADLSERPGDPGPGPPRCIGIVQLRQQRLACASARAAAAATSCSQCTCRQSVNSIELARACESGRRGTVVATTVRLIRLQPQPPFHLQVGKQGWELAKGPEGIATAETDELIVVIQRARREDLESRGTIRRAEVNVPEHGIESQLVRGLALSRHGFRAAVGVS